MRREFTHNDIALMTRAYFAAKGYSLKGDYWHAIIYHFARSSSNNYPVKNVENEASLLIDLENYYQALCKFRGDV